MPAAGRSIAGKWTMTAGDCKTFEIDKGRFCFRLTATYNEERWEAARKFARERNTAERLK